MGLENLQSVDAISTDKSGTTVQLTMFDAWDWADEGPHLLALQNKINAYFDFVQSKQIFKSHPAAVGKALVITVMAKFPISDKGVELLRRANQLAEKINIKITHQVLPTTEGPP